jgi:hypothetical protein
MGTGSEDVLMADYKIKVRRFLPESGQGPFWEEFNVDLEPSLSVLDSLLQVKDREDGSLAVRCSCRAAICGSCGVRINGRPGLACLRRVTSDVLSAGQATCVARGTASVGDPRCHRVFTPVTRGRAATGRTNHSGPTAVIGGW